MQSNPRVYFLQTPASRKSIASAGSKPPKVEYYDGMDMDVDKINHWLENLESYFALTGALEIHKVFLAKIYLTGPAGDWFKDYLRTCNSDEERMSYPNFRTQFRKAFIPPNEDFRNEQALYNLCQTKSVQEYTMKFQQLLDRLSEIQRSEKSLLTQYIHGLSFEIGMLVTASNPKRLHEAYDVASRLEDQARHVLSGNRTKFRPTRRNKVGRPRYGYNNSYQHWNQDNRNQ